MKRVTLFSILALTALLISACGGTAKPETVNLTVELSEYAFSPSQIELKVGQEVSMTVVNVGQLDHEIMFGRDVMMMDSRPSGFKMDMFESAHVEPMMVSEAMGEEDHAAEEGHDGFMVFLPPGDEQSTFTFTVSEDMVGEWEIGCFELDGVHYDAGMKGSLVVTP